MHSIPFVQCNVKQKKIMKYHTKSTNRARVETDQLTTHPCTKNKDYKSKQKSKTGRKSRANFAPKIYHRRRHLSSYYYC